MCERLATTHTCQYDTYHNLPYASLNSITDCVVVLKCILKNNTDVFIVTLIFKAGFMPGVIGPSFFNQVFKKA